jgi:hypothetical protein
MALKHATIEEVRDEFARGNITETELRHETQILDGLCEYNSQRVFVNPMTAIVETLVHELIHRRWPRWGERRVHAEARRLVCRMTDAERAKWYRDYQAQKRPRKTPKRVEE